ncbi:enoyl-CoA hydratase [Nocardioides sp. GY 10113]|uniref:enoyl-CoA hydratase-related protein n=1 Tax=Nocardioides sp. GY 10113 TaxID=2569761 RepID=UPI0010A84976|nr:enoyl-CoA hydratase-related protein [Nocardioides sp. GY 10113]TIC88852.1 enoyl-CoA hydratase [Nocardioides sp. GY 10113]
MTDPLLVERDGGVLVMTLNRPAKRNALDRSLTDALSAALDTLDDDPSLHVGIVGAQGPVFSAGTDLTEPASPATDRGGEYGAVRRRRSTPLIAAVDGPALGGGFELVLACDLVVAGRDARFGLPEVARGLVPTCAGLFRAPDRLPPTIAAELVLTGDPIDADRAHQVGLVNVLVAAGEALEAARALAARIQRNSPDAVSAALRALHDGRAPAEATGWTATDLAIERMLRSPDVTEGVTAFFERRRPRWSR